MRRNTPNLPISDNNLSTNSSSLPTNVSNLPVNNSSLPDNMNNLPANVSNLPTNSDNDGGSPGGSSGYESDENRAHHQGASDALIYDDPTSLPDGVLREFIRDTRNIVRNPQEAQLQDNPGEDNSQYLSSWANRNRELRDELQSRIANRTTERQDSDEELLTTPVSSDEDSPMPDCNPNPSSSKRKFDDDDEDNDNNPPAKKPFKQDSSDILPDCEPYDITGGDD
jgi:hypothetical protein